MDNTCMTYGTKLLTGDDTFNKDIMLDMIFGNVKKVSGPYVKRKAKIISDKMLIIVQCINRLVNLIPKDERIGSDYKSLRAFVSKLDNYPNVLKKPVKEWPVSDMHIALLELKKFIKEINDKTYLSLDTDSLDDFKLWKDTDKYILGSDFKFIGIPLEDIFPCLSPIWKSFETVLYEITTPAFAWKAESNRSISQTFSKTDMTKLKDTVFELASKNIQRYYLKEIGVMDDPFTPFAILEAFGEVGSMEMIDEVMTKGMTGKNRKKMKKHLGEDVVAAIDETYKYVKESSDK